MKVNIRFLKIARLLEFLILESQAIPFNCSWREERILKIGMFNIEKRNTFFVSFLFLKLYLLNRVIIKVQWRVWCFLYFTRKITPYACLFRSGLKVIFHWLAQVFILLNSLFKFVVHKFILSTTEKSRKLSAKSLTFFVRPSERFVFIDKK